ncbi:hypothetical protein V3W47_12755 [Deinococcus sp. YIM 134068]|uniref:hypothetical protein n=1 Tax=Deinococcus lichenicola TaxID=3118910 RepID=UPI002F95C240
MRKLLLLGTLATVLASCNTATAPYSAVGTWDIRFTQDQSNSTFPGVMTITAQTQTGELTGVYENSDGSFKNAVSGNVDTGVLRIEDALSTHPVDITGKFNGTTYAGTYRSLIISDAYDTGKVEMTRR